MPGVRGRNCSPRRVDGRVRGRGTPVCPPYTCRAGRRAACARHQPGGDRPGPARGPVPRRSGAAGAQASEAASRCCQSHLRTKWHSVVRTRCCPTPARSSTMPGSRSVSWNAYGRTWARHWARRCWTASRGRPCRSRLLSVRSSTGRGCWNSCERATEQPHASLAAYPSRPALSRPTWHGTRCRAARACFAARFGGTRRGERPGRLARVDARLLARYGSPPLAGAAAGHRAYCASR